MINKRTTQIKLFYAIDDSIDYLETEINEWLAKNHEKIRVNDIKMQTYCSSLGDCCLEYANIMLIYEVLE